MCSNFGQQCCYDYNGYYITTNGPAGSADYYYPATHYLEHQSSDYFPYKVCCVDSDDPTLCAKYYKRRPKDNGLICTSLESNKGISMCTMTIMLFWMIVLQVA